MVQTDEKKDRKFLLHIINEIAKYAKEQGYEVDDTIDSVSDWLKAMRKIATFNNLKGDWEDGNVD